MSHECPDDALGGGDDGGGPRHVVHEGQLPEAAPVLVLAHQLVVHVDVVRPTANTHTRRYVIHDQVFNE